jgi:hypothetical protein
MNFNILYVFGYMVIISMFALILTVERTLGIRFGKDVSFAQIIIIAVMWPLLFTISVLSFIINRNSDDQ